jgi:hypothetical protein
MVFPEVSWEGAEGNSNPGFRSYHFNGFGLLKRSFAFPAGAFTKPAFLCFLSPRFPCRRKKPSRRSI